jgi:hypothetical protein
VEQVVVDTGLLPLMVLLGEAAVVVQQVFLVVQAVQLITT